MPIGTGQDTLGGMPQLVLLRHGQSQWNADNLFTGWYDVDLTAHGRGRGPGGRPAAGRGHADLDLRILHTSVLTRAIRTADLTLEAAGRSWLPVRRHWRLNERHYGALQGKNKKETTARARRGPGQGVAAELRHPAAPGRARAATTIRPATPATGTSRPTPCPPPSAWPTWWPGSSPTGRTPSCPTCWPRGRGAGRCWWWPTATASGPSASTSTASATTRSWTWRSRPASRSVYQLGDDLSVVSKALPGRPGGGRGGRRGGAAPGRLTHAPPDRRGHGRPLTGRNRGPAPRSRPSGLHVRLSPQTTP